MKAEAYLHPALTECAPTRTINCIAHTVIQKSKFVQVIISISNDERNVVFIPRKIFPDDVIPGLCYCIKGEDRYKKYYGDIFVSEYISQRSPDISLFTSFALHNFSLLSETALRRIIEGNTQAFIQAINQDDIQYFSDHGLTPHIARKFLQFSRSNLFWKKNEVIQIDNK